jgi:hypothetical protein
MAGADTDYEPTPAVALNEGLRRKEETKWVAYRASTTTRWNPPGEKGPIYNR